MTKKQIIRCISFLLVAALMIVALCDLYELGNTSNLNKRFYKYRLLEKNTVDVVFLGTSGIDRYWVPSLAYEEYGMTAYPLSVDAFPCWMYINLIEEARTRQNPELFIIDIRPFGQDCEVENMDIRARRVLDSLPLLSITRTKAAFNAMKTMHEADETLPRYDWSYLVSVAKYHDMWKEKSYRVEKNWGNLAHNYLGFYVAAKHSMKKTKVKPKKYDSTVTEALEPICEQALYDLIDYIKEENLNVLFLDTPQVRDEIEIARSNTVYSILEEEGLDYLHYYTEDNKTGITIDFDYSKEFYNKGHTNYVGACRFTPILAQYLNENYDLPDRRNDENVKKDWDGIQAALEEKMATYKKK